MKNVNLLLMWESKKVQVNSTLQSLQLR